MTPLLEGESSPRDLPCVTGPWGLDRIRSPASGPWPARPGRSLFKDVTQAACLDPCLGVM